MAEYRKASGNLKVAKPNLSQQEKSPASLLAAELRKTKEREKKLEAALYETFPLDLYMQARPDLKETYRGDPKKIIEHFIRHGINEIDIKEVSAENKLELYTHVKQAASLLAAKLDKTRAALISIFPLHHYAYERPDVESSCEGKPTKILEHFIEHGIKEIDIKYKFLAFKVTEDCLKNIGKSKSSGQSENNKGLTLLKTKGNTSNLQSNKEHEFAIKHTSVHYRSNTVCTWIPKNGCSNLRYSIAKENGAITHIDEIKWIHTNNDSFNATTREALQANYTFVILRNPFKRLMSFFLDKLCHPQKNESDKSYEHASKIFNFGENLSFSDFVDYIWENPDSISCDEHTRPQCDFLLYRTYDSYFALEKIKEANQIIQEKMGIQIADIRDKNSIFTSKGCEYTSAISSKTKASEIKTYLDQNIVPMVDNMFTQDMIKKVATLYLHDIILYYNEIQGGDIELNQWISKAIADK